MRAFVCVCVHTFLFFTPMAAPLRPGGLQLPLPQTEHKSKTSPRLERSVRVQHMVPEGRKEVGISFLVPEFGASFEMSGKKSEQRKDSFKLISSLLKLYRLQKRAPMHSLRNSLTLKARS